VQYRVRYPEGREVEVDVPGVSGSVDTLASGSTRRTMVIDGRVVHLHFDGALPELEIATEGLRGSVSIDSARTARRSGGSDRAVREKVLGAPMPGRIVKVAVSPGETVSKGSTLLIIEAMKMENDVRAKHDGLTVATVHVSAGDAVEANAKLITFE
jgi:biotin carboxyl carrier protein